MDGAELQIHDEHEEAAALARMAEAASQAGPARTRALLRVVHGAVGGVACGLVLRSRGGQTRCEWEEGEVHAVDDAVAESLVRDLVCEPAAPFDRVLARVGARCLTVARLGLDGAQGAILVGSAAPLGADARRRLRMMALALASCVQPSVHELSTLREEGQLRDAFVEWLLHDLRGPLTVALTSLGLIEESADAPTLRYLASRAHVAILRADNLLRDLLDLSRVRAGQPLPLRPVDCDLSALLFSVVDELCLTGATRFSFEVEHNVRGVWSAHELRRAVWNLLSNALAHGDRDRPVTVRLRARVGEVHLSVHNFGHTIGPGAIDRVFEPHFHHGAAHGWGLGLALVRVCAEAHGGRVEVESADEVGTTFTLVLPRDVRIHLIAAEAAAAR